MLLISEYLRQMLCQIHITYSVLPLYQYNEDDSSISAELISNKFVLIQDKQREPVNYEINKENLLTMINKENLLTMINKENLLTMINKHNLLTMT